MRLTPALLAALLLASAQGVSAQEPALELEPPITDVPERVVPRVAVVIEGGDGELVREAASRLEAALLASGDVALPNERTVGALHGDRGQPGDGLDRIRTLRRRVDWTADGDREAMEELGAALDVVAIVLVHDDDGELAARVFDVGAGRFFEGAVVLDAESTGDAFVLARIRRAYERRRAAAVSADTAPAPSGPLDEQAPERRSWMGRNWPFVVAGVLLAGATTFFVVQRSGGSDAPPVIHVRPGVP